MIHMKSLIRRLDCVPWLLAACLMVVWAEQAQAQAGRLMEAEVSGEKFILTLDVKEVNEGALSSGGSHADKASVPIVVTATRLDDDGDPLPDDAAAKGKGRVHIPLESIVGSGTAAGDPLALTKPTTGDKYMSSRFRMSMPILVIEKDKFQGTATVSFVPNNDDLLGNDLVDDGRGTKADGGSAASDKAAASVAAGLRLLRLLWRRRRMRILMLL